MKFDFAHFIPIILLLVAFNTSSSGRKNIIEKINSYFPINESITMVYKSSFGESITKYFQDGEYIIGLSEADIFVYKQDFILRDDGAYSTETNKTK